MLNLLRCVVVDPRTVLAVMFVCAAPPAVLGQEGSATQPTAVAPPPVTAAAPASQPAEEGFTTTETGLKFKDVVPGTGAEAQKGDKLEVGYKGTLEDGTEFDSSAEGGPGYPVRLGMQRLPVIAGWEQGLLGMKEGGKRIIIVPPQLGYGLRGSPPKIPANATLRFELELKKLTPGPKLTETSKEAEVAIPAGGRYVDIKAGDGEALKEGSSMKVRATTWAPNGAIVNTTLDQKDPVSMEFARVGNAAIREGMMGMKAGGRRKIMFPPMRPGASQPTSQVADADMMILEVELVEVFVPPPPAPAPTQTPVTDDQYTTTPSGLKYFDLKVGEGDSPMPTSRIKVHYTGWLTDGTSFDSSITKGQPIELELNRFVQGWIEGVGAMKVGGKRKLVIPPDLAYGAQGRPSIPPNSTLVFEVELLEITKP